MPPTKNYNLYIKKRTDGLILYSGYQAYSKSVGGHSAVNGPALTFSVVFTSTPFITMTHYGSGAFNMAINNLTLTSVVFNYKNTYQDTSATTSRGYFVCKGY